MVDPSAVRRIVIDAARLVKAGEIVVFGSASLAFWIKNAPTSRDVDLWVTPAERGEAVEALMGELSWYHERHSSYVEVLGPETFAGPRTWRERALRLTLPEAPLAAGRDLDDLRPGGQRRQRPGRVKHHRAARQALGEA